MKNFKSILIVCMAVATLMSCNKDDDGGEEEFTLTRANLAGVYELTFYKEVDTETTDVNGLEVTTVRTTTGDTFQVDYNFDEDGTLIVDGEYREVFTVVVNGETTMEGQEIIVIDNENFTFSVSSNPQRLTISGVTYNVTVFNENEIQFELDESSSTGGDTFTTLEEFRLLRK